MNARHLIAVLALAVSGCMVGPDYRQPQVEVMNKYRFDDKTSRDIAGSVWWEQFRDPIMNELITTALEENKDIRVAAARIAGQIGVVEILPVHFLAIHVGNSIGRQVRNFHLEHVFARFQILADRNLKRLRPQRAHRLAVQFDPRAFGDAA